MHFLPVVASTNDPHKYEFPSIGLTIDFNYPFTIHYYYTFLALEPQCFMMT